MPATGTSKSRKRRLDARSAGKNPAKHARKNPFLNNVVERTTSSKKPALHAKDELLAHMVFFLHPKESSTTEIQKSLNYLLDFLEGHSPRECDDPTACQLARTAAAVLSWALPTLLASGSKSKIPDNLLWRSAAVALRTVACLFENSNVNDPASIQKVVNPALSSSILLKLIPLAARVGKTQNESSRYATMSGEVLMQLNFVPSFEMICESYLFGIVSNRDKKTGKLLQSSSKILEILRVTETALNKFNSRKVFQTLTTKENILEFARLYMGLEDFYVEGNDDDDDNIAKQQCQDFILNNIVGSLFDADHLEGFISLARLRGIPTPKYENSGGTPLETKAEAVKETITPPKLQFYQEGLLDSFEALLLTPPSQSSNADQDVMLATRFLPLVLRVFFERLKGIETNRGPLAEKKDPMKNIAPLQLYIFASATTMLLNLLTLPGETSEVKFACMRSLEKCVKSWSERDALVLFDEKKRLERSRCLDLIMTAVLETAWPRTKAPELAATIISSLLRLEPSLANDKLETIVEFVARGKESGTTASHVELLKLLSTLMEIYAKLRQFHCMFVAIFRVALLLHSDTNESQLPGLHAVLSDASAKQVFADGVQGSPLLETTKMFESLDSWIAMASASRDDDCDSTQMLLAIGVQNVCVGLLANVRIDETTAPVIAQCCETLMNNSGKALCSESNSSAIPSWRTMLAVTLCRWITSVQMKCSFWLGHEYTEGCELESSMTSRVKEAVFLVNEIKADCEDIAMNQLVDDMLCLACFRLQKLDFLTNIHALDDEEMLPLHLQYKQEAKRSAMLMARWAELQTVDGSGWHQLAPAIASWVPHASEKDVQGFLIRIFSAIGGVASENTKERRLALSILDDSELHELSLPITKCGLATVALLLGDANKALGGDRPYAGDKDNLCAPNQFNWTASSSEDLVKLLADVRPSSFSIIKAPKGRNADKMLRAILRVATTVNELKIRSCAAAAARNALSATRLETFSRSLWGQEGAIEVEALDLINALRSTAARELAIAGSEALQQLPKTPKGIAELLDDISKASIDIMLISAGGDTVSCNRFIVSTAELLSSIGGCYLGSEEFRKPFCDGVNRFMTSSTPTKEKRDEEAIIFSTIARSLLSAFGSFGWETWFDPADLETYFVVLFDYVAYQTNSRRIDSSDLLCDQVCLLASTLFLEGSKIQATNETVSKAIRGLAASIFPLVLQSARGDGAISEPVLYMVACFAATNPPLKQRQCLIDQLLGKHVKSDWLNISICSLIRDLEGDSLFLVVSNIVQSEHGINGLQLFPFLFRTLQKSEQAEILSSFTEAIKLKYLGAFCLEESPCESGKLLTNASGAVVDLIQEKRLQGTMSERDIAQILAQLSKIVSKEQPPEGALVACLPLVSSLVQHLPQQLFSCVPMLTTLLHASLKHLMFDKLDMRTTKKACQDFSRLCELLLPHKEIIKKHVPCLLLELLHWLEWESSVLRKDLVSQCSLQLIGMLSEYEIGQLTTMMNATMKMHFRSLHQSHKKLYALV